MSYEIIGSLVTAYLVSFFSIKGYITRAKKNKILVQPIRDCGPQSHIKEKSNTPTMGGIFIVLGTLASISIFSNIANSYIKLISITFIAFAAIGLIDDIMKVVYKNPKGLRGSIKLIAQFAIIGFAYLQLGEINPIHNYNAVFFAIGDGYFLEIASWLFVLFISFVIIGTANGTNLTDGLDGLVSMPVIFSLLALIILIFNASDQNLAHISKIPYIESSQEIIIFCTSLIGSLAAFLTFNLKPAKIFMGDVGSLAIGAVLGLIAVILKQEFIFFFIVLLFAIESISVILQVGFYKAKQKRLFLMAPLHHHFEKIGWNENKIVITFWIFSFLCCCLSMLIFFYL